ncbi:MAG: MFS transporter [Bacteroidaceae bacterium]|nr:MFS transporter [Alistipes sp.]MBQ8565116.1 MFS transporter [Bacteroidaceae bacterium]
MSTEVKDRLFTRDYIFVCIAAFMMSFSFFILVPTLPLYLKDTFGIGQAMVGVVLSCYVVAVLSVRPMAGFVADTLPRKSVYIISYAIFVASFLGYFFITQTLALFILLRVFHGFSFGMLTTAGNTLVIDVMPSSRRGEGLGYYGVTNNLAMAFGPMAGLFITASGNYTLLFLTSLLTGTVGLILGALVRAPRRELKERVEFKLSADRFFMKEGIRACIAFMLLAIPYGMTTSYMALYAKSVGITHNAGLFFTVMAAGLIASRLHSGKQVDRGYITETIRLGICIAFLGALGEASLATAGAYSVTLAYVVYFVTAFLFGYGYGTMFPAYNTLFINLAPNSRRATANATYLTGWDVGIGGGMLLGGYIAEYGYSYCYIFGAVLVLLALIFFVMSVTPHFHKYRLR